MQGNPFCPEFTAGYKEESFNSSTDAYGLLLLTAKTVVVVSLKTDQSVVPTIFMNNFGITYARITDQLGNALTNAPVSGTYYYLEN